MAIPFSADEIFEMAEQIERNGGKFYRAAAQKFPTVRALLLELAKWEDVHEKIYAGMRAELAAEQGDPTVFDPDDQAQMYLRVMADGHVFNVNVDPTEQVAGQDTPEDILRFAIGIERDSIAFFVGLKQSVSNAAGREKVEGIIKEEMKHVAILNKELEKLA